MRRRHNAATDAKNESHKNSIQLGCNCRKKERKKEKKEGKKEGKNNCLCYWMLLNGFAGNSGHCHQEQWAHGQSHADKKRNTQKESIKNNPKWSAQQPWKKKTQTLQVKTWMDGKN